MRKRVRGLSELEQAVMEHVWEHGPVAAIACADALRPERPMRDSTVRTVFHRLERKGFVSHETVGRTYVYRAAQARESVVMKAVRQVMDRFCQGSAEALVLGMVDNAVLSEAQLERLAKKIAARRGGRK